MSENSIPQTSGIYKITCTANNKIYIGSSQNMQKRCWQHRTDLKGQYHRNIYLQRAFDKYGMTSLIFEVVEFVELDLLLEREQYWIDTLLTTIPNGFNIALSTESNMRGRKFTPEHRAKISAANKGRKRSPEAIERLATFSRGKILSVETRKKISIANSGKVRTAEQREKISIAHKGKKLTPEHRAKIGNACRKCYIVTSPDGTEYLVSGLIQFCKDHDLNLGHMHSVATNKRTHHKGWKCKYNE